MKCNLSPKLVEAIVNEELDALQKSIVCFTSSDSAEDDSGPKWRLGFFGVKLFLVVVDNCLDSNHQDDGDVTLKTRQSFSIKYNLQSG